MSATPISPHADTNADTNADQGADPQADPTIKRGVPSPAPVEPAPGNVAVQHAPGHDAGAPHLIFCGGFHSSMNGIKALRIADLAQRLSLACTRFDYRGHGQSTGDARELGIAHWLADTLSVVDATTGPLVMIGSSMGAWLAVLACERRPERVCGLMTIAAAPDFTHELLVHSLDPHERRAADADQMAWRTTPHSDEPWPIPPVLIQSGEQHRVLVSEQRLCMPATLIHGTADVDVPPQLSRRLLERRFTDDAQLIEVAGADHRLSDDNSLRVIDQQIEALLGRVDSWIGSRAAPRPS
jgi:pimeloyl-ACP methyl ester carboxylesterase